MQRRKRQALGGGLGRSWKLSWDGGELECPRFYHAARRPVTTPQASTPHPLDRGDHVAACTLDCGHHVAACTLDCGHHVAACTLDCGDRVAACTLECGDRVAAFAWKGR